MTLVFENDLVAPTLTLTIAYLILSIYASRRLIELHKAAPEMNTRKLFVMTCSLTTILRLMTFGSMTAFNYAEFHLKVRTDVIPTTDDIIVTDAFFEKATLVLLDVPDWCCISAYVLLIVVCAEALLQSRRHWLSSFEFRRTWILGYLVFNALLYTVQVCLYSLMFMPSIKQEILTKLIYLTLTFFNLGLPVVWVLGFLFLSVRFSGFPYSSISAKKRLNSLVRLGSVWTIARLGWGFIALTSVMQDWLNSAQKTVQYYSLILISVYFFAEILPITFSLQSRSLDSLAEKSVRAEMNTADITSSWEEKMLSRTPSGHVNEYSSIYESNGSDGPRSTQGPGQGAGTGAGTGAGAGSSSNRPFQASERSASRGEGSGRNASASASNSCGSCSSYQAEEGHDRIYHGGKPFLPVVSAPFHFAQSGNDECKQEPEHDYAHEKFSSPLRGYFSLPPQDLPGTASTSSTDCSTALPTSPFDRELGLGLGAEGREERGRGAGRGREGGTGRGKARDRDRSIDSTLSLTSESSYVAAIESCRHSKRSQPVQYEGGAGAALGLDYQSTHPSIGSKIGLLLYDSDRKWGSWLGL